MKTAFVAFCSPAGSTRHVAQVIAGALDGKADAIRLLDLGLGSDPARSCDRLRPAGAGDCLFVGSPVYRELCVPPVMAFLDGLPPADGCAAVPFVTWGGATSGIALWQMGKVLEKKGYRLVGAAKVMAVHAMMWTSNPPVGLGHPDADDDRQVADLIGKVIQRLAQSTGEALPLDVLDYQPAAVGAEIKKKLGQPWMIVPKSIDETKCTQCAICKQICPVTAVSLDPFPVFDERCFDCFNCIRECPEEAITPGVSLEKIAGMIRERVEKFNEQPPTQVFC